MLRPIITIDEEKCNGCGQCILDCAEGALAIVDGKARLVSDVYCDGLGACLNCPRGALSLVMREASPFDEAAALAARAQRDKAEQRKAHSGTPGSGCPGSAARTLGPTPLTIVKTPDQADGTQAQLPAWPVKLHLVPADAPFLTTAHLLLAADCAGFALPHLHHDWLEGRIPLIACPKLENGAGLRQKLADILRTARPQSLTVLRMSVPCCGALERMAREIAAEALPDLAVDTHTVRLG